MSITNSPVSSHIVGQQSSCTAQNNPAPALDPESIQKIQHHLVLLLHAHKCRKRDMECVTNGEVRQCILPHCRTMKNVLNHLTGCSAGKLCPVIHCSSSKQILSHCKSCKHFDCSVCFPLREARRREKALLQYSSQNLHRISTQQFAQKSQSQVLTWPLLQNITTSAIGNQPAQNILLANNLQPKVKTENVASIKVPPTVPEALPNNPTVVKDWHQYVTPDLRYHLVQKIVQVIFPSTDITTLVDPRILKLVAYAQKVEAGTYNVANSKDEYYQLLAETIYQVLQELEEKRQKQRELQKQQQLEQVGGLNLSSMLGNNEAAKSPEVPVTSATSQLQLSNLTASANQQRMSPPNVTIQTNSAL